jgi:hypothetical protein
MGSTDETDTADAIFSPRVLTLIILLPVRPSRENVISIPTAKERLRPSQSAAERARVFGRWCATREIIPSALRTQARESAGSPECRFDPSAPPAGWHLYNGTASTTKMALELLSRNLLS